MTKRIKHSTSMRNSLIVCMLFLLFGLTPSLIRGQNMSINESGTAPNGSAMLDVASTNKGLLLPRMTQSQRLAIASPADGLIVYQNDGDIGLYIYDNALWSKLAYLDNLTLAKVLELGKSANSDTIIGVGALAIGNSTMPRSSIVIDSFLTVQGKPYSGFRWYGYNTYVDNSNQLRFLHNKSAGVLGFGDSRTLLAHWEQGAANSIVPNSANSQLELSNNYVRIQGEDSAFQIELKGVTKVDSLEIDGGYVFPTNLGLNGQVLTTNGIGRASWENPQLDNLGNHIATQNIQLGNFFLSGDGGNEGIHVASNGNVTIGNTTGFENFAVWNSTSDAEMGLNSTVGSSNFSMRARGSSGTNNITAFKSRGSFSSQTSVAANDQLLNINVQPYNGTFSVVHRILSASVSSVTGSNVATRLGLYTTSTLGVNTERLRITDNGNIGINKTNPSVTLDVNGDVQLSGELRTTTTGAANMIPIAYGYVSPTGTLSASAGSLSVAKLGTGIYEITITGRTYSNTTMVTNATIVGSTYGFITTDVNSGKLLVTTKNASETNADIEFHFVIYQP